MLNGMSEMVERVKVALIDADVKWYAERHPSVPEQEIRDLTDDDNYRAIARAAIKAMREPTRDVLSAFVDADTSFDDAKTRWECAIDAALSEVEG